MRIHARNSVISIALASLITASNVLGADAVTATSQSSTVAERNLTIGIILGALIIGNAQMDRRTVMGGDYRRDHDPAPEPDPTRKISVQDCSKPIELDGGNLRCK
jgi:hypothetical protein